MTSFAPRTAAAAALAALAVAGTTGLPVAQARPMPEPTMQATPDLRVYMHTSSLAGTTSPPSQDLRSPDARDAAAGRYLGSTPGATTAPVATPDNPAGDGVDWTAVALGAIGGAGLVLVPIAAGGLARRRPSHRRRLVGGAS
jgi:hypothetical protein